VPSRSSSDDEIALSVSTHDLPSGVQLQVGLDGLKLTMPGPPRSGADSLKSLVAWCALSPIVYLLLATLGGGAEWVLMLGLPLLVLGPWIKQELGLALRDSRVHIELQSHAIRFSHRSITHVIPFSAIRMVDASESQTPLVTLKLNWAEELIECPRRVRGLPVTWVLETRAQARWLTALLRRVIQTKDTAEAVPESLQALVTSAVASQRPPEREPEG
jgi:hypothetical protein